MKQVGYVALNTLLLALSCAAQQIPINSSIAYDANDPTHAIVLTWEAIPTKILQRVDDDRAGTTALDIP